MGRVSQKDMWAFCMRRAVVYAPTPHHAAISNLGSPTLRLRANARPSIEYVMVRMKTWST